MELLRITRQIHCKAVEQRATLIHRQYNRDWGTSYSRPPIDPYLTSSPLLQNPGDATVLSVHLCSVMCTGLQTLASTPPGMPGTHPPIFWLVETSTGISAEYYYVLSDIADRYWFPSVRSASSRFHSAIRRHRLASVRQADSRLTRLVPPNLQLALTPLFSRVSIDQRSSPQLELELE